MPCDLTIGSRLGRYKIERLLGEGGMGCVYRAVHVDLGTPWAVKVIADKVAKDEEFRARFKREARNAFKHRNVVAPVNFGDDDGRLYFVAPLVDGRDLAALLAAEGPLEPARAVRLVGDVAEALHAGHEAGLIHRDVKPANIMVEGVGDDERALLTDFGLARPISPKTILTLGAPLLTPAYASPEQKAEQDLDPRTDVYSLGVVLYEALLGELPFDAPRNPRSAGRISRPPSTRSSPRR